MQCACCHLIEGDVQGMGGSSIGIWCAHGEGRAHFPDPQVKQAVLEGGLAPIRSLSVCQCAGLAMGLPRCFSVMI